MIQVRPTPTGDPRGPHRGDVFQHAKSGRRYVVLGIARLNIEDVPAVRFTDERDGGEEWVLPVRDWFSDECGFELVGRVVLA
jgi:hypothetical protein